MKTVSIATFVMGMAAIFAAGCSAETGAPGEGVGQTSEALSNGSAVKDLKDAVNNDAMHTDVNPDPVGRELAASCEIVDGATHYMLSIGGFAASGSPHALNEVFAYTPGSPGTWTKVATLSSARGLAKAIQIPGNAAACLVAGGLTDKSGGSDVATAEKISVSSGVWTVANAGNFSGHDFALAQCGSNEVIAIGGRLAAGTLLDGIKRYNGKTGTTAWPALQNANGTPADVKLSAARASFAFAVQNTSFTQFVAAGGQLGLVHATDKIDAFVVEDVTPGGQSTTCRLKDTTATTAVNITPNAANKLRVGRFGAVAFPTSSTAIKVVAGDNGATVEATVEDFSIDWTTAPTVPALSSNPVKTSPAITGVRYPALVKLGTFDWMLLGGEGYNATNYAGTAISTPNIQKFASAAWSTSNLVTTRAGNIAEFIGSTVYTAEGKDASSNLQTTTEAVTP